MKKRFLIMNLCIFIHPLYCMIDEIMKKNDNEFKIFVQKIKKAPLNRYYYDDLDPKSLYNQSRQHDDKDVKPNFFIQKRGYDDKVPTFFIEKRLFMSLFIEAFCNKELDSAPNTELYCMIKNNKITLSEYKGNDCYRMTKKDVQYRLLSYIKTTDNFNESKVNGERLKLRLRRGLPIAIHGAHPSKDKKPHYYTFTQELYALNFDPSHYEHIETEFKNLFRQEN